MIGLGRQRLRLLLLVACVSIGAHAQSPVTTAGAATDENAVSAFKRWDKNGDGSLTRGEFSAGWQEVRTANLLTKLGENFKAKDLDHNGILDATEYAQLDLVEKAGASAPPLATFDNDKSGGLSFQEYVRAVGALLQTK